jgi:tungstate transport system ATP-binding protein
VKAAPPVALLRLFAAGVRFGEVQALAPLNLAIHHGEFVALLGANGSGKTTLLRLLHGLLPHAGLRESDAAATRQAMVFQNPFFLHLSALNNLRIALWLAGVPRIERTPLALQALARVGLLELRQRSARALSGGQQQRLALARAWAVRPQVLFLDEPTANLDPYAKNEVESLLQSFANEGMTLVMSTHNLGQAKRLASRVVYLEAGVVKVDLPTADFFNAKLTTRADTFLHGELPWS